MLRALRGDGVGAALLEAVPAGVVEVVAHGDGDARERRRHGARRERAVALVRVDVADELDLWCQGSFSYHFFERFPTPQTSWRSDSYSTSYEDGESGAAYPGGTLFPTIAATQTEHDFLVPTHAPTATFGERKSYPMSFSSGALVSNIVATGTGKGSYAAPDIDPPPTPPELDAAAQESASQQIKAQRGRPRCRGVDAEETLAKAAEAARLASDATRAAMAEAFDKAHSLGARGDPAYRQAKALRDRMYRQRDVAAALFFAANNGALLGPDAAVHRCSEIGFEGVVDVAVAACGTHFGVGHDVLIDLHWLSARDATFVVDAALDELEATVNRRKASLKFIAGRGRHSVGAPKLGAAVRACLEKRPRLKAAEVRPGVFDVRVRAASP